MWNKVILEANLGGDPVLRETKSGKKVLNFSGAVHGRKDSQPVWIGLRAWNKLAEAIAPYLGKGDKVFVEARIPNLPAPHKTSVRNGAEPYLTADAKKLFDKVLDKVRNGEVKNETAREFLLKLISTQVTLDVTDFRFGSQRKNQEDEVVIEDDDDEIPF